MKINWWAQKLDKYWKIKLDDIEIHNANLLQHCAIFFVKVNIRPKDFSP